MQNMPPMMLQRGGLIWVMGRKHRRICFFRRSMQIMLIMRLKPADSVFPFPLRIILVCIDFYNALFFFLFRFFRFTFLNETTTLTEAGHMQVSPPLSTKPHQKTILDSPFLFFPNNCLIPRFLPSIISFSFFYNLHKKI